MNRRDFIKKISLYSLFIGLTFYLSRLLNLESIYKWSLNDDDYFDYCLENNNSVVEGRDSMDLYRRHRLDSDCKIIASKIFLNGSAGFDVMGENTLEFYNTLIQGVNHTSSMIHIHDLAGLHMKNYSFNL